MTLPASQAVLWITVHLPFLVESFELAPLTCQPFWNSKFKRRSAMPKISLLKQHRISHGPFHSYRLPSVNIPRFVSTDFRLP